MPTQCKFSVAAGAETNTFVVRLTVAGTVSNERVIAGTETATGYSTSTTGAGALRLSANGGTATVSSGVISAVTVGATVDSVAVNGGTDSLLPVVTEEVPGPYKLRLNGNGCCNVSGITTTPPGDDSVAFIGGTTSVTFVETESVGATVESVPVIGGTELLTLVDGA
jgi:hypothetical protein